MGAGMGDADCVPASGGMPACPGLSQVSGAVLGLGKIRVSGVAGNRTTPVGKPEVLGVGAWACIAAPASTAASRTAPARITEGRIDSIRNAPPIASQRPAKSVISM